MALIETHNITKSYELEGTTTHALRGINLCIEQGEFVAVMGPSGSGKSTLLHILGFLDRPTHGSYVFEDHAMEHYQDTELARIRNEKVGFVFQAFNLMSRTTVLSNVLLPLQYSRVPDSERNERARVAIDAVQLSHRLTFTTGQLSGGERQRVAIARALVNTPRVIFADEPTGNLDSAAGAMILETFDALHHAGHTIILITHETPAAEYAQRIVTMRDGSIVKDEKVEKRHTHFTK